MRVCVSATNLTDEVQQKDVTKSITHTYVQTKALIMILKMTVIVLMMVMMMLMMIVMVR